MNRSVKGVFRDGKVDLLEPAPVTSESRVIVTFLTQDEVVDLAARGISSEQAADLRARLRPFEEDWRRPDMDAYDAL